MVSTLIHEHGHAYAAKILFNAESKIHVPLNPITLLKEGAYTKYLTPLPTRGKARAFVSAAGPLSEIAALAFLYKASNYLPANGNLSYAKSAIKCVAAIRILSMAHYLLIPYTHEPIPTDGTKMWYALGVDNPESMFGIHL